MLISIAVFAISLAVLILIHEFGHFLMGKLTGVEVEEFGIGYPPRLFGKKIGKTLYSINAIPAGGFVRFKGDIENPERGKGSLISAPLTTRILIVVAGIIMNIVLGWLILVIGFNIGLPQTVLGSERGSSGKIIREIVVTETKKESPAYLAGLSQGDIIIGAGSHLFSTGEDLKEFTAQHKGETVSLKIKRYGKIQIVPVKLAQKAPYLGVWYLEVERVKTAFKDSLILATKETINVLKAVVVGIGQIFKTLVAERRVPEGVAGPVGIWFLFKTAVKMGTGYVLELIALISLNLAILNFIPFPGLDGGRFLFLALEGIRRKKLRTEIENAIHLVGFIILILLFLAITYRDILQNIVK